MTEQSESKRDGSKLQPNSGRGKYKKGDAKNDYFLIDYKEFSESFSISRKVWAKLCSDLIAGGRIDGRSPTLKVVLGKTNKLRLWVVEEDVMEDYMRLRKLEEEGLL